MSRHDCKSALAASMREYECRKHGVPMVAKEAVILPEGNPFGLEGTVKVCPECVAEARERFAALRVRT